MLLGIYGANLGAVENFDVIASRVAVLEGEILRCGSE
jgi:hypothetical protein